MKVRSVLAFPAFLAAVALVTACPSNDHGGGGPSATSVPDTATSASATAATVPMPHPSGAASATEPSATAAPSAGPVEPTASGSCPEGMVLIEGDYCTEVEHQCLIDWYAPQNKKVICEEFVPDAKCVGERVHKRFCIDKYEWPNQKGVRPEVMNNFYQAQVKCAAVGKRMCTESEWNFACEGPEMKPFPYGFVRDPKKCNGDHKWDDPDMVKVAQRNPDELARLWRGVPSGSQGCVSDFGVEDMTANADEVCAGEVAKAKYASVHTGGPWYNGVRNQCRPKVYTHGEDFYYYFLSFRCCANPDAAPNEPLTKRQLEEKTSWKEVERLAQFGVESMKKVLDLKREGKCECDGNKLPGLDIRGEDHICKTMCGTLLGANAKDGDDSTRLFHEKRKKIGSGKESHEAIKDATERPKKAQRRKGGGAERPASDKPTDG